MWELNNFHCQLIFNKSLLYAMLSITSSHLLLFYFLNNLPPHPHVVPLLHLKVTAIHLHQIFFKPLWYLLYWKHKWPQIFFWFCGSICVTNICVFDKTLCLFSDSQWIDSSSDLLILAGIQATLFWIIHVAITVVVLMTENKDKWLFLKKCVGCACLLKGIHTDLVLKLNKGTILCVRDLLRNHFCPSR